MAAERTDEMMDEIANGKALFAERNGERKKIFAERTGERKKWVERKTYCQVRNILLPGTKKIIARYEFISVLISN